jgi:hypothetical protein
MRVVIGVIHERVRLDAKRSNARKLEEAIGKAYEGSR